jgi:hypothetical protein
LLRRDLLVGGVVVALGSFASVFSGPAKAQGYDPSGIKALVFDVIGI